ncbi:hypothetical protein [Paraburkholderia xenovorans]|uniref:hypothetical protein n=1 Tax=Paraburkholderia xenovorans TaxID=36873 RepID=UPI0038B8BC99
MVRYPSQPLEAYCAYVVDEQKTFQHQYGLSFTDSDGRYTINVPPDAAGEDATPPALFVEVSDAQGQVVQALTSFQPKRGVAQPLHFVLPEDDQSVGKPPPNVHDTAMPSKPDSVS